MPRGTKIQSYREQLLGDDHCRMAEGSLTLPPLIPCAEDGAGVLFEREVTHLKERATPVRYRRSLYKMLPKQSLLRPILKDAYRDFKLWLPWAYYLQEMSKASGLEPPSNPRSTRVPESGVVSTRRTILQTLQEINHETAVLRSLRRCEALRQDMRTHRIRQSLDRAWINRMQRMSFMDAYRMEANYELFRQASSSTSFLPDTPLGHSLLERLAERIIASSLVRGCKPKGIVCCDHKGPLRGVSDGGMHADTVRLPRLYESYPAVRSSSTAPRVLKFGVRVCGKRYGVIAPAFLLRNAWPEAYDMAIQSKVKRWVEEANKGKTEVLCKRKRKRKR